MALFNVYVRSKEFNFFEICEDHEEDSVFLFVLFSGFFLF